MTARRSDSRVQRVPKSKSPHAGTNSVLVCPMATCPACVAEHTCKTYMQKCLHCSLALIASIKWLPVSLAYLASTSSVRCSCVPLVRNTVFSLKDALSKEIRVICLVHRFMNNIISAAQFESVCSGLHWMLHINPYTRWYEGNENRRSLKKRN